MSLNLSSKNLNHPAALRSKGRWVSENGYVLPSTQQNPKASYQGRPARGISAEFGERPLWLGVPSFKHLAFEASIQK